MAYHRQNVQRGGDFLVQQASRLATLLTGVASNMPDKDEEDED